MSTPTLAATTAPEQRLVSPQPIFQTFFGYIATAALGTAVRLGLFDALGDGARDARAVAEETGADERGVRILLEALTALHLLEPDPAGWRLAPVASSFLVRGGPAYLGDLASVFYSDWQWRGFLTLPDAVRTGGSVSADQDLDVPLHEFWATYAHSWAGASGASAAALAEILGPWASARRPFESLDLACGGGWYSFALASACAHAQITLLDQPHVIVTARRNAEARGLLERTAFIEGDMFQAPLGGPYDLVVVSQLLHMIGPEQCRRLLRRLAGALKPGGQLAIHDFASRSGPGEEPTPRLFSLIMLVRTHFGEAHSLDEYRGMLAETGFTQPELHELPGQPTCVLLSRRAD